MHGASCQLFRIISPLLAIHSFKLYLSYIHFRLLHRLPYLEIIFTWHAPHGSASYWLVCLIRASFVMHSSWIAESLTLLKNYVCMVCNTCWVYHANYLILFKFYLSCIHVGLLTRLSHQEIMSTWHVYIMSITLSHSNYIYCESILDCYLAYLVKKKFISTWHVPYNRTCHYLWLLILIAVHQNVTCTPCRIKRFVPMARY